MMIYLLRKPFKESLAENALAHKCGGLNIDACRVPTEEYIYNHGRKVDSDIYSPLGTIEPQQSKGQELGRWPANLILNGKSLLPSEVSKFFLAFGEESKNHVDSTQELTHISLCAGYGGIDLGLKRVFPNVRTVAYSEIDAFCCANLVKKIEEDALDAAPIWTDLKTFPWASFSGRVDILSGGFPCQPFSTAGSHKGTEDPRHLWPYICEGIRVLRPSFVFFENVEGITTSKLKGSHWRDPEGTPVGLHVLRELERLGYESTAGTFSAAEVGAPHQRKRFFFFGKRAGLDLSTLPKLLDFERFDKWPSLRGQRQYDWEPPRTAPRAGQSPWLAEDRNVGDTESERL